MAKKSFQKQVCGKAQAAVDEMRQALAKSGDIESATLRIGNDPPVTIFEREPPDSPTLNDSPHLRTQEDRWREHVGRRITEVYVELDALQDDLAEKQAALGQAMLELKDAKTEIAGMAAKLKSYAGQMRDIQNGTFSPPLFDKETGEVLAPAKRASSEANAGASPPDPAETASLEVLGLSESFRQKLAESQLAKEVPLKTVADLERAIAAP